MAVKLRLRREGAKKTPHFRVVAADSRAPRDGRFIEILGDYHPAEEPSRVEINAERALYWLSHGAQPTNQVRNLLEITGVWEQFRPGESRKRRPQTEASKASRKADAASQVSGIDETSRRAPAPEEVAAEPGTPEDATAAPVAETEAVRGETEGGPGEGHERDATHGGGGGGSRGGGAAEDSGEEGRGS